MITAGAVNNNEKKFTPRHHIGKFYIAINNGRKKTEDTTVVTSAYIS
jgi:homoserine trans-succinylase